jgi:antitoxin (DNA-binding transcriptional repressor) of toxin-antitoxin stability system
MTDELNRLPALTRPAWPPRRMGAPDLKRQLERELAQAERGRTVIILPSGKPIARLIPPDRLTDDPRPAAEPGR